MKIITTTIEVRTDATVKEVRDHYKVCVVPNKDGTDCEVVSVVSQVSGNKKRGKWRVDDSIRVLKAARRMV